MTDILMLLMILVFTGFSPALGAVDFRKLCDEQKDVHCEYECARREAAIDVSPNAQALCERPRIFRLRFCADAAAHTLSLPPTVDLAYDNATVDIYAPGNFLGQDRNPNGPTSALPLRSRARARFTCKGESKDSIFNLTFNYDGSSEVRASPDNVGKGKAAFNDAPTVHVSATRFC